MPLSVDDAVEALPGMEARGLDTVAASTAALLFVTLDSAHGPDHTAIVEAHTERKKS
jgi:hypothetical protein